MRFSGLLRRQVAFFGGRRRHFGKLQYVFGGRTGRGGFIFHLGSNFAAGSLAWLRFIGGSRCTRHRIRQFLAISLPVVSLQLDFATGFFAVDCGKGLGRRYFQRLARFQAIDIFATEGFGIFAIQAHQGLL